MHYLSCLPLALCFLTACPPPVASPPTPASVGFSSATVTGPATIAKNSTETYTVTIVNGNGSPPRPSGPLWLSDLTHDLSKVQPIEFPAGSNTLTVSLMLGCDEGKVSGMELVAGKAVSTGTTSTTIVAKFQAHVISPGIVVSCGP